MSEKISLPIASTSKRVSAFVIDDLMLALLMFVIFYEQFIQITLPLSGGITQESIELFEHAMHQFSVNNLVVILALKVLYHTFFVWQNGMTFGKYLMRIRVVSLDTKANPSLSKALLRALLRILSEVLFYLGFLMAFFLPLRQTLHDKLSHCVVVDV